MYSAFRGTTAEPPQSWHFSVVTVIAADIATAVESFHCIGN